MKKNKKTLRKILFLLMRILPFAFWIFVLFGFDSPYIAILTLLCALIHELGHISAIFMINGKYKLKSVFSGFKISVERHLSYDDEIKIALSGPLGNLMFFIISSLLIVFFKECALTFAILNLLTAISNLLPIESYDGYRALECLIMKMGYEKSGLHILSKISFTILVVFSFISLYLIKSVDAGYWIFFIFIVILIKNIKKDKNVFFVRKREKKRDFRRF